MLSGIPRLLCHKRRPLKSKAARSPVAKITYTRAPSVAIVEAERPVSSMTSKLPSRIGKLGTSPVQRMDPLDASKQYTSRFSSVAPVVAVDPNIHNPSGPAVIATNFEGAVDATNHLIALGHRRIAFIGGRDDLISAHVRREAFEQTMSSVGIPLIPDLMRKGEFTTESGIEAAKELFSIDQPPTAIFAANDQSAIGVIKVAEAAGIRIPEDLSLVGFDNIPEAAYHDLTTIDQFVDQLGYVGTVMLVKLIKGIPLDNELETINTKLVIRGSSKSLTKRETGNKTGFMSSVKGTQRR